MVDLKNMTQEQREELREQFAREEKEQKERVKKERETYKKMVDEALPELFTSLKKASEQLANTKKLVYDNLSHLIDMKKDLYNSKEDQQTHTFTTQDGSLQLTIGYRVNDAYDDTVNEGVAKVKEYMETLAKDDNSKRLVNTVLRLLARDGEGNLKPSRVMQLKQLAKDVGDNGFLEGVSIIEDAYKPVRTRQFVTCRTRGTHGEWEDVPLSMTEVNLPE